MCTVIFWGWRLDYYSWWIKSIRALIYFKVLMNLAYLIFFPNSSLMAWYFSQRKNGRNRFLISLCSVRRTASWCSLGIIEEEEDLKHHQEKAKKECMNQFWSSKFFRSSNNIIIYLPRISNWLQEHGNVFCFTPINQQHQPHIKKATEKVRLPLWNLLYSS